MGSNPSLPATAEAMPSAMRCVSAASGGFRLTVAAVGRGTDTRLRLRQPVEAATDEGFARRLVSRRGAPRHSTERRVPVRRVPRPLGTPGPDVDIGLLRKRVATGEPEVHAGTRDEVDGAAHVEMLR